MSFAVVCGDYELQTSFGPEAGSALSHATAELALEDPPSDAPRFALTVRRQGASVPLVSVRRACAPGPLQGFTPAALLVPETHTLFLGAGHAVQGFRLDPPALLWEQEVELGFWGWARHGDVVIMCAELGLAAWDVEGLKLWERFVEPPWSYAVDGEQLLLEVMGEESSFPLRTGPTR